jgi:hypothetical protein
LKSRSDYLIARANRQIILKFRTRKNDDHRGTS